MELLNRGAPIAGRGAGRGAVARRGLALLLLLLLAAIARAGGGYEYDVKAVFLHHFTRYVRWPAVPATEPFEIVVLGESDILAPLRAIASRKTVDGRPIVVRQAFAVGEIGHPRLVFVAKGSKVPLAEVIAAARGGGILTVSEAEGNAARGIALNFVPRGGSIGFEVNERAIREAGLSAGAQLLEIGIRVEPAGEERR